MQDTFMTVTAVIIVVVVMFVVPLMLTADQNDTVTQTTVDTIVSDFVNTSAKEGKISRENYDSFTQALYATGNVYNVEIEVQHFDDNPGKKGSNLEVVGENIYYSVFTDEIEDKIRTDGAYNIKKGDYVLTKVENSNATMGTQVRNFVYRIIGRDTIAIESNKSALVSTTTK